MDLINLELIKWSKCNFNKQNNSFIQICNKINKKYQIHQLLAQHQEDLY